MSRSGGIPYHLKAFKYKGRWWGSHLEGVRCFLQDWNPGAKRLILIGPSAGYSLPTDWLKKFDSISAVEPDALARSLFELRHQIRPKWYRQKFSFQEEDPMKVFQDEGAAILFCNLLGQIPIKNVALLRRLLEEKLQGREWASYHDALSGDQIDFDLEEAGRKRATLAEMKAWIYVRKPNVERIDVNAHYAPDLFQFRNDLEFRYWQWRITPERTHLTEGVFPKREVVNVDENRS